MTLRARRTTRSPVSWTFPSRAVRSSKALPGMAERTASDSPRPLAGRPGCDLSFSGLKAAVRRTAEAIAAEKGGLDDADRADLAASFEAALRESIVERARSAMRIFRTEHPHLASPILAGSGGVLANRGLRSDLDAACGEAGFVGVYPDPALCTDNGAMIAWAAIEHMRVGAPASLSFPVRARWPLDALQPGN